MIQTLWSADKQDEALYTKALSFNHCCGGEVRNITYCKFVFVALVILQAMRMCLIVTCGLSGSTIIFFHVTP